MAKKRPARQSKIGKRRAVVAFIMRGKDDKYGIMAYYRSPSGRIVPESIQYIPQAFNGEDFDMSKAERLGLQKLLEKKRGIKKDE